MNRLTWFTRVLKQRLYIDYELHKARRHGNNWSSSRAVFIQGPRYYLEAGMFKINPLTHGIGQNCPSKV